MGWSRLMLSLAAQSLRKPAVGIALLTVAWRFRRRGWHRQFPFLPLPAREYVRWRLYTAYGREDAIPPASDIVRYARWASRKS
jgi:hypothetical protein